MIPTYQLVIHSGPMAGKAFPLEKSESFIGRDLTNDIVINDAEISRRHARIFVQGTNYVIEDLGSTNGTAINGQRIMSPHILRPGELIILGEHVSLLFEAERMDPDATVASAASHQPATVRPPAPPSPPPPAYNTPYPPPPPSYAGQVPTPPMDVVEEPRKTPIWLLILGAVLLLVCICVVAIIAIDSLNLWCTLFGWFFGPEACP
ncbi:MAG: FHA domain-containing protein [Chloroflexi bacterium]|nr:FHA domain-containing protein [Anaerolineaceae bacterium]NMB91144.1 FHA domain-containing protein [Chloroflexota bacterium]